MIKAINNVATLTMAGAFLLLAAGFSSCKKKIDPEANHITGVFHGRDCNHNPAPNVLARESEDKKSIAMTITPTGIKNACFQPIDITGELSGLDVVTFLPQSYTDKCGHTFTASGTGKISGHVFGYYITFVMDFNGTKDSVKNCFEGSK